MLRLLLTDIKFNKFKTDEFIVDEDKLLSIMKSYFSLSKAHSEGASSIPIK